MFHAVKVKTSKHAELIDITNEIKKCISDEKIEDGIVTIYVPHTTAAITINEGADPDVQRDILEMLSSLIPYNESYHHREGNSDAHIKSSFLGSSIQVIIQDGKLVLGTWQSIFFFEGDGPRNRTVFVKSIKEK